MLLPDPVVIGWSGFWSFKSAADRLLFLELFSVVTSMMFFISQQVTGDGMSYLYLRFLRMASSLRCKYILCICKYSGRSVVDSLPFVT